MPNEKPKKPNPTPTVKRNANGEWIPPYEPSLKVIYAKAARLRKQRKKRFHKFEDKGPPPVEIPVIKTNPSGRRGFDVER